jgi:hypothetical protein
MLNYQAIKTLDLTPTHGHRRYQQLITVRVVKLSNFYLAYMSPEKIREADKEL